MEPSVKLAIYFLIISSEVDSFFARPLTLLDQVERKERQVVQPTWLTRPDLLFIDPNVRVTEQNLKETANIRQSIQSAVDAGTFAVDVGQPNKPIPVIDSSETVQTTKSPFGEFDLNRFDISQWNFQIFNTDQQNAFTEEMRRIWQEFVEISGKLLNFDF